MVDLVRQEPATHGLARPRYRLADLRTVMPALADYTLHGMSQLLRRCHVRLKRGRLSLHSPDPAYAAKCQTIARVRSLAQRYPQRVTLVYADEMSLYRQPSLAPVYAPAKHEPTSPLAPCFNRCRRFAGALDAVTGRLTWIARNKMTVPSLCAFLQVLRLAYPGRHLFLVWDNWPVHHHERVVATAKRLRIHLVWQPTYAPWTNPIEKLWRKLRQEVVHCHRLSAQWDELQERVTAFLDQFATASPDLLRYVGLLPK